MCLLRKIITFISLLICLIFLFSSPVLAQLELEWSFESLAGENHKFRDIAVNVSEKKLYISDSYTDVVYIYDTNSPEEPIGFFGDPSWKGMVGPYGIDIARDQKIYIAVLLLYDETGTIVNDYSLWQCLPNGKNLKKVCTLPDMPRGIKAIGGGKNTVVYVSGSNGKVIKCTPLKFPFEFKTEILFNTEITNQQDIIPEDNENICYTSSWWRHTTPLYTPYDSPIIKWQLINGNWEVNDDFKVSIEQNGNYPGIELNNKQNILYAFQVGFNNFSSHIYKICTETGDFIDGISVAGSASPGDGSTGAGGIAVTKKANIYYAGALGIKDGNFYSVYGKVEDLNSKHKTKKNSYEQNNKQITDTPSDFVLTNYPNPFNPSTSIEFSLPKSEFVTLKVYNVLGIEIATLVSEELNEGNHVYQFNGNNLTNGIYYYKLVAGKYKEVRKMLLVK